MVCSHESSLHSSVAPIIPTLDIQIDPELGNIPFYTLEI